MIRKTLWYVFIFLFLILAFPVRLMADEITVSAAMSLKDAFDEIAGVFQRREGVKVNMNWASSGILQRQIEQGAPSDVYASAGQKQMDELERGGFILEGTRTSFARNSIVLTRSSNSKAGVRSFEDLIEPQISRVAIGNPRTSPAGQYAKETLENMGLWEKLQPKLILAEHVRQVLDYVVRDEVDVGIVYATDATSVDSKVVVLTTAPEHAHSPIVYPIAVVKNSEQIILAEKFVKFVTSREGQGILSKHGFLPVERNQ